MEMDCNRIENSQRQWYNEMNYENNRYNSMIEQVYIIFNAVSPTLQIDGDEWCCRYGDDLMSGIVGFGKSPHEAIMNWYNEWVGDYGRG